MINSVSAIGNQVKNFGYMQKTEILPQSKNLNSNNVDTFSKSQKLEKGPTCGIDCCFI